MIKMKECRIKDVAEMCLILGRLLVIDIFRLNILEVTYCIGPEVGEDRTLVSCFLIL